MIQRSDMLDRESKSTSKNSLVHQQAVERVIRAMRDRLNEPLTLQDMADIAHLSPNHFHRTFHRLIGIPPGEFLTALRLDAAKRLLLTTSMRVTDICFEVGYSSLGSFTTRFTELVGLAPRRLRQQIEHVAMPSLESIRPQNFVLCHFPVSGCFYGRVRCAEVFRGLIYVGLFPRPIPQGRPARWIVLGVISFASVLGLKELTRADISSVDAYKITENQVVLAPTD